MAKVSVPSGIELEYETLGSPADPTVLLVMGLAAQLIHWPDELCRALVDAGRHVVLFDNRDCGLSTKHDGIEIDVNALIHAMLTGDASALEGKVPYTLSDLAADAVGLLDHLGIEHVHAVGASMGGMIVQTMAIEHPSRLRSLTSIMSNTGETAYGQPSPEAQAALLTPAPRDRAGFVEHAVRTTPVYRSKRYFDADAVRRQAGRGYDRCFYPEGAPRQVAAIAASGSRAHALPEVRIPTLVIHGLDDTLIHPSGGRRTAELIPGATLIEIEDMGHDFPEPFLPAVAAAIIDHTASAA